MQTSTIKEQETYMRPGKYPFRVTTY